ncbi:amidohydrolase [Microbacterium sp. 18062]|uniref:amidohydrolase n=1 Tax=Microbacterium sp. 18062 TaxID=2681410 RepID=UPI00135A05DC|nr:amidohydrolase family protein [Microbacterium sp. 18062]
MTGAVIFVAPVVTMDPERPDADAFAVAGDRIVAVGTLDEVRAIAPGAREEALDGTVLPGLIDAHMHMERAGLKALVHLDDGDGVDRYIEAMRDSFDDDGPTDPSPEDRVRALERVQPLLHALGFTGIVDPAVRIEEMRGYQEAHRRGRLTMRTVAMPYLEIGSEATPDVDAVIAHLDGTGVSTGFGDELLRIGPIKVYLDGEALKGEALLDEPWDASGFRGRQRISDEDFARLVAWCAAHGWGVGTHAVGSAAIALVASEYEKAGDAVRERRFQFIHAYLETSAESIASAARSGAIASLQPSIIWHNGSGLRAKLGERAERANPVRSWLDGGATVAFGSDGPFFAFDPRHLMWQAVTRRVAGESEPLSPTEAITVEEALAAYTTGAAVAALADHHRGMIRPGHLADWALWGDDPRRVLLDDLRRIPVLRTDVGGRTVHTQERA